MTSRETITTAVIVTLAGSSAAATWRPSHKELCDDVGALACHVQCDRMGSEFRVPERQAWCCLQAKLCDPCLSALYVPWCEKALYKYSSFPFLSFPVHCTVAAKVSY